MGREVLRFDDSLLHEYLSIVSHRWQQGLGGGIGPIFTGLILAKFGYSGSFLSLGLLLMGISLLFALRSIASTGRDT